MFNVGSIVYPSVMLFRSRSSSNNCSMCFFNTAELTLLHFVIKYLCQCSDSGAETDLCLALVVEEGEGVGQAFLELRSSLVPCCDMLPPQDCGIH